MRAKCLHDRINKYFDLACYMKDVRKCLRERAVTCWRMGDDDVAELHEYKGDDVFEFADFYGREATKAFKKVREDRAKES